MLLPTFTRRSLLLLSILTAGCANVCMAATPIKYSKTAIMLDGFALEASWSEVAFRELDQILIGDKLATEDFNGRYKLLWNEDALYLYFVFTDDVLADAYANPLEKYWEDDCVEIFVDEDASGGNHQYDYNAFAYHIALDGNVVDIGPREANGNAVPLLFNHHIQSKWRRAADTHELHWEIKIALYDDNYLPNQQHQSVRLAANKTIGFMLAYCDADGAGKREHFIGSYPITPVNGDKNLGYITADVFEKMRLIHQ